MAKLRHCARANKPIFPTQLDANLKLSDIQRKNNRAHRRYKDEPVRSYRCEFCGGYHLTSQAKRSE